MESSIHQLKFPLLIDGLPGTGKTYLANKLLKDTVLLRIDTNSLKNFRNIKEYILERLKKRNVTLMFQKKNEQRGLLIDDIHIFYKYDKISYKLILELIKDNKYYGCKIILTCCSTFIKNKDLCKIKIFKYKINYDRSNYYKLCFTIIEQKKIKLSGDECDKLIYHSNYNLNIFMSELDSFMNQTECVRDNYDSIEKLTDNLLKNKYSFDEIFRICENDEIIIGFNLLQNCLSFLNNYDCLSNIYEYYSISDNIETFKIKNQTQLDKNYSMGISICIINYFIHKYYKENNSVIIYNKYISKSMANTVSLNIYKNIKNSYSNLIIYLFDTYRKFNMEKYKDILIQFNNQYSKEMKINNNKYECFYNQKINLNKLKY